MRMKSNHLSVFISSKWEIEETVSFWNFRTLFTTKFPASLFHFGTPISIRENEVTGQMKHAAMPVTDYIGEVYVATRR